MILKIAEIVTILNIEAITSKVVNLTLLSKAQNHELSLHEEEKSKIKALEFFSWVARLYLIYEVQRTPTIHIKWSIRTKLGKRARYDWVVYSEFNLPKHLKVMFPKPKSNRFKSTGVAISRKPLVVLMSIIVLVYPPALQFYLNRIVYFFLLKTSRT